ncbi:MAG: DUF4314 domain-containing protein [Methanobrevibacter sp.]|nr:DUF4314 domain-containing protein [Methanobrevibacter sp.]
MNSELWPTKEEVSELRKKYPEGTIIKLLEMDDPTPVPPGTYGIVNHVDDVGQIHCDYLNYRSSLGILPNKDEFKVIQLKEVQEELLKILHDSIKGKGYPHYKTKTNIDLFNDAIEKEKRRLSNCWDGPFDKSPEASVRRIINDFNKQKLEMLK